MALPRITIDGRHMTCPDCRKLVKIGKTFKIARHGQRFERVGDYPQHERGNVQFGSCPASGMELDGRARELAEMNRAEWDEKHGQ